MRTCAYALIAVGWATWLLPFILAHRNRGPATRVDRRARWGMLIQAVAYSALWQGKFWLRDIAWWQVFLSALFFLIAGLFSWTAASALGKQFRMEAALSSDHELVTSGPYKIVRHPVYSSMLCVLCGTGVIVTPASLMILSLCLFIIGTEIRVRVEERLLQSRFGEQFTDYSRRVSAYAPGIR